MMGRATRHVVPPIRKIKLDRVYAQPWGPLYPRERKSFGEPLRSERCQEATLRGRYETVPGVALDWQFSAR